MASLPSSDLIRELLSHSKGSLVGQPGLHNEIKHYTHYSDLNSNQMSGYSGRSDSNIYNTNTGINNDRYQCDVIATVGYWIS